VQGRNHSGPHSGELAAFPRHLADLEIGLQYCPPHVVRRFFLGGGAGILEQGSDRIDRERTRHLSGRGSAHSIRHNEQGAVNQEEVLVVASRPPDVGNPG